VAGAVVGAPAGLAIAQHESESIAPDSGGTSDEIGEMLVGAAESESAPTPANAIAPPEGPIPNAYEDEELIGIGRGIPPNHVIQVCEEALQRDPADELCRLVIQHAAGQIEPGIYTQAQVDDLLSE
jgi:hypothetical protein